jgi:hypothetical protein
MFKQRAFNQVIKARFSWRQLLINSSLALLLVGSIIYASVAYQDTQAKKTLKSAHAAVQTEDYSQASKLLTKANDYYSLPNTKRDIQDYGQKVQLWALYSQRVEEAKQLVQKREFENAHKLLVSIDESYPGYGKVVELERLITTETNVITESLAVQPEPNIDAPIPESVTTPPPMAPSPVPKNSPTTKPKYSPKNPQNSPTKSPEPLPVNPLAKPVQNSPDTPSLPTARRMTSTDAKVGLASATTIAQAKNYLQTFASQYGLTIQLTTIQPSWYVSLFSTYAKLGEADLAAVKNYGALFIDEWAKYPTDWVKSTRVKSIAIVKRLSVIGQTRAANWDPAGQAMYYDVGYLGDYAREVVHHEYNHLFTYNFYGSATPNDAAWSKLNSPGFSYGLGGAFCYVPGNSCLTGDHPVPGFVSGYSTSGMEEDRAEVYAYMFTTSYYKKMKSWMASDTILVNKFNHMQQFINKRSPVVTQSFFNEINP